MEDGKTHGIQRKNGLELSGVFGRTETLAADENQQLVLRPWKKRRSSLAVGPQPGQPVSAEKVKAFSSEEKFRVGIYDLFLRHFDGNKPIVLKEFIDNLEKSIILNVLEKAHGNQREAAKILGVKYTTLNEKLKKHKIRLQKNPVVYAS
jgi:DNA-binding protein Fis